MNRLDLRCSPITLFLLASLASSAARGQTPEAKAQAEALFEEGIKKLDAGDLAPACKALETSNRLDPGIGTLLFLADCYERSGKTASAWAAFREAASLAQAAGQAEREAVAQRRAAALSSRLSRVVLELPPGVERAGLSVTRNGLPVARELWTLPTPVDPGHHVYEASAPGKKKGTVEIDLKEGDDLRTVRLPSLEDLPTAPSPPPAVPPSNSSSGPSLAPAPPPSGTLRTAGVVVAGLGLLGIGAGGYLALRARSQSQDADALCSPQDRSRCSEEGTRLGNDARSDANLATVMVSIGGAALAGGALMYLLSPSPRAERARLLPVTGPSIAGLSLRGTW